MVGSQLAGLSPSEIDEQIKVARMHLVHEPYPI